MSKENNSISANCRCGSPSYPAKTHPLSPPSPLPAGDDTVDQSMAETFVSMYLDMTQVNELVCLSNRCMSLLVKLLQYP